ncbi:hypothetical protein GCM10007939_10390 [Amylibacter marinus]|uniref:Uncharacterized protein n=1 Tax=Amylibacter marinus TaxID=1475483 RepID=A0ABQ5VTQ1_9RHOB|nr:hypothetical protein [Amylibacter marinus]GLQ34756.1 hypothetical protein GCM10007939_10390 [Amylibacter marinus]
MPVFLIPREIAQNHAQALDALQNSDALQLRDPADFHMTPMYTPADMKEFGIKDQLSWFAVVKDAKKWTDALPETENARRNYRALNNPKALARIDPWYQAAQD